MEIALVMGFPASGKSTWTQKNLPSHRRVNRDLDGGTLDDLIPLIERALDAGESVVLDNTYATADTRKPVLDLAKRRGVPVRCVWLDGSIEDAQRNAAIRLVQKHGRLPSPAEIKSLGKKDPNTFPPAPLFAYRKRFEKPTAAEGFAAIERVVFARELHAGAGDRRAVILDYDGTLRTTKSGEKYPRSPDDIAILPGRAEKLARLKADGWLLFGVSNQGDVARGKLSEADARACFARTNALLGHDIEVRFCPHDPAPISCWCRKPMPGFGVEIAVLHGLDPARCVMVGDQTTDETFAKRAGFAFEHADRFFATP